MERERENVCVCELREGRRWWRVLVFVRAQEKETRGKMKERFAKEKDREYKERKGAGGVAVGCSQPNERWRPSRFLSVCETCHVCTYIYIYVHVRGRASLCIPNR